MCAQVIDASPILEDLIRQLINAKECSISDILRDLYSQDFYKDLPRGMKSAKGQKYFFVHGYCYFFTDSCGIYVDETVLLGSNDEICVYAKLCNDKMTLFTTKVWFSTDVSLIGCQYLIRKFPHVETKYEQFIDDSPILADLIQQLLYSEECSNTKTLNDLYSGDFYKSLPKGIKSAKGHKCFCLDGYSYLFTESCGIYFDETVLLGSNDEICVYAKLCNGKITLFTTKVCFNVNVNEGGLTLIHKFRVCEKELDVQFIDDSPILADLIQRLLNANSDLEWCSMTKTLRDLYSQDFYRDLPKGILLQNRCFHDAGKRYNFTDSCGIYEDETVLLGSNDEMCVYAKLSNGNMALFTSKLSYVMRMGRTLIHKFPKCDYLCDIPKENSLGTIPESKNMETKSDDNVILKELIAKLDEYYWDYTVMRVTLKAIYSQQFYKDLPLGIFCKGNWIFYYSSKRYGFNEFCGKYKDGVVLLGCDGKKCVFVNQEMKLLTANVSRIDTELDSMFVHLVEQSYPKLEDIQDFHLTIEETGQELNRGNDQQEFKVKENLKSTRYYLRTCDTDHNANDKIRRVCQESTLHEITQVGQVIHAPSFSCEVLTLTETEIMLNRKITKFKTSDIFENLSKYLTRDELHEEIDKLCNSEKFNMKQTFAANVSYPDMCAQFFVMKLN